MEERKTFGSSVGAMPKTTDQKIKKGAAFVAANAATVAIIAAAGIIIATTWLDIDLAEFFSFRFATDAILTVILYCIVQLLYTDKGVITGKLDPEYKLARASYLTIRDEVSKMGKPYLGDFCVDFVDSRLKRRRVAFIANHLKGLSYDEWEDKFRGLTRKELKQYRKEHKKDRDGFRVMKKHIPPLVLLNKMSTQNLSPEMLMLEEPDEYEKDAMSNSPRTVLKRKKTLTVFGSVFAAFFVVSIFLTLGANPTWAGLVYMFLKLFFLAQRAFKGYSDGCLAYSVNGVTYHTDQRIRIEEYLYSWLPQKRAKVSHEPEQIESIA